MTYLLHHHPPTLESPLQALSEAEPPERLNEPVLPLRADILPILVVHPPLDRQSSTTHIPIHPSPLLHLSLDKLELSVPLRPSRLL